MCVGIPLLEVYSLSSLVTALVSVAMVRKKLVYGACLRGDKSRIQKMAMGLYQIHQLPSRHFHGSSRNLLVSSLANRNRSTVDRKWIPPKRQGRRRMHSSSLPGLEQKLERCGSCQVAFGWRSRSARWLEVFWDTRKRQGILKLYGNVRNCPSLFWNFPLFRMFCAYFSSTVPIRHHAWGTYMKRDGRVDDLFLKEAQEQREVMLNPFEHWSLL